MTLLRRLLRKIGTDLFVFAVETHERRTSQTPDKSDKWDQSDPKYSLVSMAMR